MTISSEIRKDVRMPSLPTLTQHTAGNLSQSNKTGERNTRDSNREGGNQITPICR
jgi:hypothetical protein